MREGNEGDARAMTEDASEEAAWRDLVAHYASPAAAGRCARAGPPGRTCRCRHARARRRPPGQPAARTSPASTSPAWRSPGLAASPYDPDADARCRPGPRLRPAAPGPFGGLTRARRRSADTAPAASPAAATRRRRAITSCTRSRRPCRRAGPGDQGRLGSAVRRARLPAHRGVARWQVPGWARCAVVASWPDSRRWSHGWATGRRATARTRAPWSRPGPARP